MSRRKKRGPVPRCEDCRAPLRFFKSATSELYTPFNWHSVDGHSHVGGRAYPIDNGLYWPLEALVDELMARLRLSREEALELAYDKPWYVVHTCIPTDPQGDEEP